MIKYTQTWMYDEQHTVASLRKVIHYTDTRRIKKVQAIYFLYSTEGRQ